MTKFRKPVPPVVSELQLEQNNKSFTIDQVQAWVEEHDCIDGRIRWFEGLARTNEFYQRIAKPLLSMRTVGSIDVERVAKPLKHAILTAQRNKLADGKGTALLRCNQNLKHMLNAKLALKKSINESLISIKKG